jgi:signal transduction histidine kinase
MTLGRRSWFRWSALALSASVVLAVAAGLAWEAWQATERHRAAAEGTLRDYAEHAADAFRQRYIGRAWVAVDAIFRPGAGRPAVPRLRPRYLFRLSLADSSFEVDGPPLSERRRQYLLAQVNLPEVRHWREWDYNSVVDTLGPEPELVYLSARRAVDGELLGVRGFAVGLDQVAAVLLRPALGTGALLAVPGQGRMISNDSLLSVTVLQPGGPRMLQVSPMLYRGDYAATVHASRFLGAWKLRVTLNPELAPGLLIGGLPPTRAPVLAAMVLLATVLVGITVFVVWRGLELARLRSEFVASISHELRTPLAQILLFGESLTLGRMQSRRDVRSAGRVIVDEARRLMRLVDNVMLFSRNTRPSPPSTREPLAPLLREVIDAFAPVAAVSGAQVSTTRVDDIAAPVDLGAIRQVLFNLMENAVKYGPRGQHVSLGLAAVDGHARLWVEDEGPGIPPAEREHVWQPFVRLRRDVDRQTAGSGIGLSLVREVVARHRGSARIEETPAGGARVVVDLPHGGPLSGAE